ncbi:MAG: J domain-containing protein [Hyphomicrobiaceae bacterium]|nr:J domain-containing protein [Hyphomicrobiaceae bacterium]
MARDPYDVLGLKKDASQDDIRKTYRKLAKKFHPDLNPGDTAAEERFKEISGAFAVLGDEDKRKRYDAGELDETGAERPEHQYYRQYADADAQHQYHSSAGFEDFADLSDLFKEAFSQRGYARGEPRGEGMKLRGADVRYNFPVEFLEAAKGEKKRVTMPDGAVLDISIPAGIDDGKVLRLKGKGQPGLNGGAPGDALVVVEVRPHKFFERDGKNILVEVPISVDEAILGGKVQVPTISGQVNVTVPKGASSGQTLRLRGKGVAGKGGPGDQLVRLKIVMPDKIDDDLEKFMKSWAEDHSYDPRKGMERAR